MTVSAASIAAAHITPETLYTRLGHAITEITNVLASLDAIDDAGDRIAEHARSCQVPARQAELAAVNIAEDAAIAAGYIRRAEQSARSCHSRLKRLIDVETEAQQGRC
jgi:hypothetical protein